MIAVSTMPSCQPATVRLMPSRAIEPFIAMYRASSSGARTPNHQFAPSDSRRVTRPTPSTWPCMKCPPSSFIAVSGRSRLTRVPGFISPKLVRRSVSPERSAEKLSPEISTAVRQQPFTAMLPDFASPAASGPAFTRMLAPMQSGRAPESLRSNDSIVPTYSTSPVNIVQVSLDCEIDAKLRHRDVLKVASSLKAVRCGSDALESGDLGRQEHSNLIHESGCESGGIQSRACFEQYAQYFTAAKFGDDCAQVGLLAASRHVNDFDSGTVQRARLQGILALASEHEHITVRRAHQLRPQWEAQGRIHYHSQQLAPPWQARAVGEQGIVTEHRANACEQRVGGVAHALHFGAGLG